MAHSSFLPPAGLRNQHIQSFLASLKLRYPFIHYRARALIAAAEEKVWQCSVDADEYNKEAHVSYLHSYYSSHSHVKSGSNTGSNNSSDQRDLVVLIHGWEGSSDSLYLLSAAAHLFNHGFDVVRLHLRDHGPSHHLNGELFHAYQNKEVEQALRQISEHYPHRKLFLAGFSLGGNYSLRVAADMGGSAPIDRVVAICPVLQPNKTMQAIEEGLVVYRRYFVKKWQRSLKAKVQHYPNIIDDSRLLDHSDLDSMTQYFVKHHTPYNEVKAYFDGYALTAERLKDLSIATDIFLAEDDPIIPAEDAKYLPKQFNVKVHVTQYGGHCGYVSDYRMNSWIDQQLLHLFSQ